MKNNKLTLKQKECLAKLFGLDCLTDQINEIESGNEGYEVFFSEPEDKKTKNK